MDLSTCGRVAGVTLSLCLAAGAAQAQQSNDAPKAPQPQAVQKVTVKAVAQFGFDQSAMRPEDQAKIISDLGKMSDVTWQSVEATGFTDSTGSVGYNQGLSERRAAAVRQYLMSKGVDGKMIAVSGKGPSEPVADNSTREGRAQNRRTEIEFRGVKAAAQ